MKLQMISKRCRNLRKSCYLLLPLLSLITSSNPLVTHTDGTPTTSPYDKGISMVQLLLTILFFTTLGSPAVLRASDKGESVNDTLLSGAAPSSKKTTPSSNDVVNSSGRISALEASALACGSGEHAPFSSWHTVLRTTTSVPFTSRTDAQSPATAPSASPALPPACNKQRTLPYEVDEAEVYADEFYTTADDAWDADLDGLSLNLDIFATAVAETHRSDAPQQNAYSLPTLMGDEIGDRLNALVAHISRPERNANPTLLYRELYAFFFTLHDRALIICETYNKSFGREIFEEGDLISLIDMLCSECLKHKPTATEPSHPYATLFITLCMASWLHGIDVTIEEAIPTGLDRDRSKELYISMLPNFFGREGSDILHFTKATNALREPAELGLSLGVAHEIIKLGGPLSGGGCCSKIDTLLANAVPALRGAFRQSARHFVSAYAGAMADIERVRTV